MPSRIVPNSAAASAWRVIPYRSAAATQIAPTAASTMGYCREIGSPQRRQRPRKSSHETTGMLSRQAMGCLQRGQVEGRSEEHTSELQSLRHLVCRLLLEKKKKKSKSR